jgi:Xaa-Pro aminopeptidase
VLKRAQQLGVEKANDTLDAGELDQLVRGTLAESDLAKWFIHRLGHGIGLNTHEDPYLVAGNKFKLVNGNVFSIEPGFYIPDKWGARIEDIVAIVEGKVINLNDFDHELQIVF